MGLATWYKSHSTTILLLVALFALVHYANKSQIFVPGGGGDE